MKKGIKINKLSVVIPVFNEDKTLKEIVGRIYSADILNLKLEIIIVDDCSTDCSWKQAQEIHKKNENVKIFRHSQNKGKGASLKTALSKCSGEIVLIQDADLEYDPKDYFSLLKPILDGKADVVYGSRFRSHSETRVLYFWHRLANGLLTICSNMFTNLNLTDMETGYKAFRAEAIKNINLKEKGFGIEPEITIKLSRKKIRFFEVGISYNGRTYNEGKKIKLSDAFIAVYCLFKYRFF